MSNTFLSYNKFIGSDQLSLICTAFIQFIEEILLPIPQQDTKQFQYWTKFKEIIDPFNQTIEFSKIPLFIQSIKNSKNNLENQITTQTKNNLIVQDRNQTLPQTNFNSNKSNESQTKLKEISERINKVFHQNNTHLDILLKMNDTTQDAKLKLEINNQRNTSLNRRMDFKRRNTDYYSLKPINI